MPAPRMTFGSLKKCVDESGDAFTLYVSIVEALTLADNNQTMRGLLDWSSGGLHSKRRSMESSLREIEPPLDFFHVDTLDLPEVRRRWADLCAWFDRSIRKDAHEHAVAMALQLLSRLDGITAALLRAEGRLSHPDPADPDRHTIVVKPAERFNFGSGAAVSAATQAPGTLRTQLWELLRDTYIVAPAPIENRIRWRVRALPETVERKLAALDGRHQVLMVCLPHHPEDLIVHTDLIAGTFTVRGLRAGAGEIICEDLNTFLRPHLTGAGPSNAWSVVICPEYSGWPDVREWLRDALRDSSAVLVFPGSAREPAGGPQAQNLCRSLGPGGVEGGDLPSHAKIIRYPLHARDAPEALQAALRARTPPHLLEDIDVAGGMLTIWHSQYLGRFAVVICRDLLDDSMRAVLSCHYLDHLFVPAMSPTLDDFAGQGADLAALLGAGLYVANAALWAEQLESKRTRRPAAVGYRPRRGAQKDSIRYCYQAAPSQHRVCVHGFSLKKGWLSE